MAILHGLEPTPSPREQLAAALNGHPVGSDPLGPIVVDGREITCRTNGTVLVNSWLVLGVMSDGVDALAKAYRAAVGTGVLS